jgi:hypothetical protein
MVKKINDSYYGSQPLPCMYVRELEGSEDIGTDSRIGSANLAIILIARVGCILDHVMAH